MVLRSNETLVAVFVKSSLTTVTTKLLPLPSVAPKELEGNVMTSPIAKSEVAVPVTWIAETVFAGFKLIEAVTLVPDPATVPITSV